MSDPNLLETEKIGGDNDYLQEKKIAELMDTLTRELFQTKPTDVCGYLIESLKRKRAERDAKLLPEE
jgi:hypothetical protein